jgi:hypothetical protein
MNLKKKTPMSSVLFFVKKHQRTIAMSLFMASVVSCTKNVMENEIPLPEESHFKTETMALSLDNILFRATADGFNFLTTFVSKQTATSYGITASSKQAYNGSQSVRFELRDSDAETKSGTRSEISFPDATSANRWYSYALYVPGAQYKYDNVDEVISQWHQGGENTPSLCLRTKADRLYLRVMAENWIDLGAIDKDNWHTYVMHVKHSSGSDGLIELWRDGKKIVDRDGANMYKLSSGNYHMPNWKLGIYKAAWNNGQKTGSNLRVLYFDDIKLGGDKASYNEMAPTTSNMLNADEAKLMTQKIQSFTLVNAENEKDVLTITNGQTIDLKALRVSKANIRANMAATIDGSVLFELSGKQSRKYSDDHAPYSLQGDDNKKNYFYGKWDPPAAGTYTLKATIYSEADGKGLAGTSKTITFKIK